MTIDRKLGILASDIVHEPDIELLVLPVVIRTPVDCISSGVFGSTVWTTRQYSVLP